MLRLRPVPLMLAVLCVGLAACGETRQRLADAAVAPDSACTLPAGCSVPDCCSAAPDVLPDGQSVAVADAGDDSQLCECVAGQTQCILRDTALRSCPDGCTWVVELCLGTCVAGACCKPCSEDPVGCLSPSVTGRCIDGCVVSQPCTDTDCAGAFPMSPYSRGCLGIEIGREKPLVGCHCGPCRTEDHCNDPQTLGVTCSEDNRCVCQTDADCVGKTAGPRCIENLCGCARSADCPGGESCVPANLVSLLAGHPGYFVCSGNRVWPR